MPIPDHSLIYAWTERPEEAIERNKDLYVAGRLSLAHFASRVECILKWEKEGCRRA